MSSQVNTDVFARYESKVQSYARSFPQLFATAQGTEVFTKDGKRYLDFLAGAGSLNYGHNNSVLKDVLLDYITTDGITHSLDLHTAAKESFLVALRDHIFKPRGMDYVVQFTGPTGANAVEAALKIARKVTGRSNVISFTNGFHGVTVGVLSLTGNSYLRGAAGVALQGATAMPFDGYMGDNFDTIAYIEKLLNDPSGGLDKPAAMILECVQGEGGLNVARPDWLQRLAALCKKHEILLIADDIQAGCGRTGSFFSFEPAGIKPDIVTLSKSLSGYGLPLSIVLIERSLDLWEPGEHNGTFRGNNHAFVTAAKMLEHYWGNDDFTAQMAAKGEQVRNRLGDMAKRFAPKTKDIKGRGMMSGLRFNDPADAGAVAAKAFELGLIIERCGPNDETIKCFMPLTTSTEIIDEGLDILERSCADILS